MNSVTQLCILRSSSTYWLAGALAWLAGLPALPGAPPSFRVLHTFGTNAMGLWPSSRLVQGPEGRMYGTALQGGCVGRGQVFAVNPDGTHYAGLKDFQGPDGASPGPGLLLSGAWLYGTTERGGAYDFGTVFKVQTNGAGFMVLKEFRGDDGAHSQATLTLSGNRLYRTTQYGGTNWQGVVFSIGTDGSEFAVLRQLGDADGIEPAGGLVVSGDLLYGTAWGSGSLGGGTLFSLHTDGSGFALVKEFGGSEGESPAGDLLLDGEVLYGTTAGGGTNCTGTVFKVNTDGSAFAIVHDFGDGSQGAHPPSGVLLDGASLYGTTESGGDAGNGVVFKVGIDGNGFAVLEAFNDYRQNGVYPCAGLMLSGTNLYGACREGGRYAYGALFRLQTDGGAFARILDFMGGDGNGPYGSLPLEGKTLYGATVGGGGANRGTVFKIDTHGNGYALLMDFTNAVNGAWPQCGVLLSGSTLYGTAPYGGVYGSGTIFRLDTNGGAFTVLRHFDGTNGAVPMATPVLVDATLYGSTLEGGDYGGGTLFKMQTNGDGFAVLKHFNRDTDGNPRGDLLLSGSTLYGGAGYVGGIETGTIFRIGTDGSGYTILKQLTGAEGSYPQGGLILSGNTLFGATYGGGQGYGTLFRMNTDGTGFANLKTFNWQDGAQPGGCLLSLGSTLYGTTASGGAFGSGTLFRIATDGTGFVILKNFSHDDGTFPRGRIVLDGEVFYGSANSGGFVEGGTLFSLSPGPPLIDVQPPENVTAALDDGIQLSVQASGYPPPDYQWFFEGTNAIPSGTNAVLYLPNLRYEQRGAYTVVVANDYGSVTSRTSTLTVMDPTIFTSLYDQSVHAGGTVLFHVGVAGTLPLSYQWFKDAVALTEGPRVLGPQTDSLTISNAAEVDQGGYFVVVSNAHGVATSQVARLTVLDPFIVTHPASQTARAGQTVSFGVVAGGTGLLSYQWLKDGTRLADAGHISGSHTATVTFTPVSGTDAGGYSVIVSGSSGSVTSQVATFVVLDPFIISQTASLSLNTGETAVFNVTAGGTEPLIYQWLKDGTSLSDGGRVSGAQTATLTVTSVIGADRGGYSVAVNNAFGSVTSQEAALQVSLPPPAEAVTVNFEGLSGMTFYSGNPVPAPARLADQFLRSHGVVFASESGLPYVAVVNLGLGHATSGTNGIGGVSAQNLLAYSTSIRATFFLASNPSVPATTDFVSVRGDRWYGSGVPVRLEGFDLYGNLLAVDATYDDHAVVLNIAQAGIHSVRISEGDSVAWDDLTFGRLVAGPAILVPPQSQTAEVTSAVTFSVRAAGAPLPAYAWFFNGQLIDGVNTSVLSLSDVQFPQAGVYTVAVTNALGAVTSPPAMLTVIAPVERRQVAGITLIGQAGSILHLEYSHALEPANWLPLDMVPLVNPPQVYLDLSNPLPPQRFYRAWQTAPADPSVLRFPTLIPALTLTGSVGSQVRVDAINAIGPTDAWFTLATVTLTNTSQYYFDVTASGQPARLYRIVPLP